MVPENQAPNASVVNGTSDSDSKNETKLTAEESDPWHWFYHFRTACDNKPRLGIYISVRNKTDPGYLMIRIH